MLLWQLPAGQHVDILKLETFCKILDTSIQHVFEFRHSSWFNSEIYDLLNKYNCTICILSAPGNLPEYVYTTSDIAYIRFHGKNGWYDDNYSEEQLDQWVEKIKPLNVKKIFTYFNNDFHGFAVQNGIYFSKKMEFL